MVQVLRSDLRGEQAPVLAAVGPMQFEVAEARMNAEFGAPIHLEPLAYTVARRTIPAWASTLNAQWGIEVLHREDGELLALFPDGWRVRSIQRNHPDVVLEPLVAT